MSFNWRRAAVLGAMTVAIAAGSGCAQERDPINRVQPNALAKSFFVGPDLLNPQDDPEFWTQATLVDAPYGVSQGWLFPSTFSQALARIKFQITEDLLLGRLTYELIQDADGKGAGGAKDNDGQIIVAYRIQSHFDIRRAYNPSTGEELNVVEENSSDRPWYEREYMRVDWSENLQTDVYDFDTLSIFGAQDGIQYSSLAYYVSDPSDPNAPYFDIAGGYFDVTNKAFAVPGLIDLSGLGWGIGKYPSCQLPDEFSGGTWPSANCNPAEITIRQGFRKVEDHDFEPGDWDGMRFQAFGAFYKDRYGYARNYGMSDAKWHRFIARYQIWERSHYYDDPVNLTGEVPCYTPETTPYGADANRDTDANGTADECEVVTAKTGFGGSQCDTFKQRCTLPFRARKERPLAWYVAVPGNLDYFEGSEWAAHDWDVALRHAVTVAKYAECRSTNSGDKPTCTAQFPTYFGQMDDHLEAMLLSREVDDCRHGLSFVGANNQPDFGAVNSGGREAACQGLADTDAAARTTAGAVIDPGVVYTAKMPEMVVLCHSPVETNDPAICAPPELRLPANVSARDCATAEDNRDASLVPVCRAARYARRGDLRYHLVNLLWEPHTPSPWGIMTNASDPTTGEVISGAVTAWTHVNDLWSQGVVDRIRLIKGELKVSDVTEAKYVADYAKATEQAQRGGMAPHITKQELKRRVAAFVDKSPEEMEHIQATMDPSKRQEAMDLRHRITSDARFELGAPSVMGPMYEARRQQAVGTSVEAELMNTPMQQLAGVDKSGLSDAVMDYASPLRGMHPGLQRKMREAREMALAARGACMLEEAPAPVSTGALADVMEEKFKDTCVGRDDLDSLCKQRDYIRNLVSNRDGNDAGTDQAFDALCVQHQAQDPATCLKYGAFSANDTEGLQTVRSNRMRLYLAQRAHMAVIVHEMGHMIGDRHNFVSSADAFSYRPQYWQLRTKDGTVTTECDTYTADGENCIGPRWFDPVTDNEAKGMIWAWSQDSVMDYAGEYTMDTLGLAAWDYASAVMFYGGNVAVFDSQDFLVGKTKEKWLLQGKMDNFGGILGIAPEYPVQVPVSYVTLQKHYNLIQNCAPVDTTAYKPAAWDDGKNGAWHPLFDGLMVAPNGTQYTKCRQQQVDYVPWNQLRMPTLSEGTANYRGGPAIDLQNRIRVPYGFASDGWADIGNASVYRHDNGADTYEIFNWLAVQEEIHHIFDNYRRQRQSFSLRAQSNRNLERYDEKIRDGAKGLALLVNVYRSLAETAGYDFDTWWPTQLEPAGFEQNIIASGEVFDHFVRNFMRPQTGPHYLLNDGVYHSQDEDSFSTPPAKIIIPNGGFPTQFGELSPGGKLVENGLCTNCGEYDRDYTMNCGQYYDKVNAPYLMTESVDNFISESLGDFVEKRYRSISLADLFPEGYRRWMGAQLTGDSTLKGARVAGDAAGNPLVDANLYPTQGLGWPSYWPSTGAEICFPATGTTVCGVYGDHTGSFDPQLPATAIPINPQVGWEEQKFLINWTMLYLPENQKEKWINQLWIWEVGQDFNPDQCVTAACDNRIELHDPFGKTYVAKTTGKEQMFGKLVQKGISARVLEYANSLIQRAYVVTDGPDLDGDGTPDWYLPTSVNGAPLIKYDPGIQATATCNAGDMTGCTCTSNKACLELEGYMTLPAYIRQTMVAYGIIDPEQIGFFNL